MRVAPVAHAGLLLGFIVVTRRADGEPFTETEDTVLTEIARQIGLALHNVQLDTALQASLDELRSPQPGAAGLAGAHRGRRRQRTAQARTQPPRRRPAAPRGTCREAAPRPRRGRGRPRRRDGDDRRDQGRRADRDRRAAGAGPRHLPAAAGVGRTVRGAAGGRRPSRAADHCRASTTSVATATTSRPPCTSARSRRSRTPASTPARAPSAAVTVTDADDVLRFEITDDGAGFDMSTGAGARPRLRQHGRPPRRVRRSGRRDVRTRRRHHSHRHSSPCTSADSRRQCI